jgi:hypothetical protein
VANEAIPGLAGGDPGLDIQFTTGGFRITGLAYDAHRSAAAR